MDATGSGDACGPANGQRHMGPGIIETGFGTGKRHSVIAGDHDDGVVQLTGFFQGLDCTRDHLVEMFDLHEVIKEVISHNRMVRKDRRYDYLGGILARPLPCAFVETAMGFVRPQPKTERLILRNLSKKIIKVGRIILVGLPFKGRFQLTAIEFRTSWIARSTSRFKSSGAPSLAGKPNGITCVLQ